jgi:hypothetical protein
MIPPKARRWGQFDAPPNVYDGDADCCGVGRATIDKLTDDALLEIFDFYLKEISKRR